MKLTSLHIKNMSIKQFCNRKGRDFAMALRARKVSGAFEKQVPAGLTPARSQKKNTETPPTSPIPPQNRCTGLNAPFQLNSKPNSSPQDTTQSSESEKVSHLNSESICCRVGLYTFCSNKRLFCSKELPPKKTILLEIMLQKYYYARIMLL